MSSFLSPLSSPGSLPHALPRGYMMEVPTYAPPPRRTRLPRNLNSCSSNDRTMGPPARETGPG
ncbi:unnamed protein product [Ectocarpus sp. 6 AP-2014]